MVEVVVVVIVGILYLMRFSKYKLLSTAIKDNTLYVLRRYDGYTYHSNRTRPVLLIDSEWKKKPTLKLLEISEYKICIPSTYRNRVGFLIYTLVV